MFSGRKLVQHHAQRKNIAARIQHFAACLFRGHISNGADGQSRTGQLLLRIRSRPRVGWVVFPGAAWDGVTRFELSQAEVQNLCLSGRRDKNVARLDVAVHDALTMGCVERVCHLDAEIQQPGVGDLPVAIGLVVDIDFVQALPLQQLHDDEGLIATVIELIDGADARMVQGGGGARFAPETLQRRRVLARRLGQIALRRQSGLTSDLRPGRPRPSHRRPASQ